jgi:hypothetical protein
MKRQIIFTSVFLVAISFIFALGWGEGEIYIGTLGLSGDNEVNYRMEAKGTVWEGDPYDFSIDTDGSHTIAYAPKTPSSTVGNTDFSSYNWSGYRIN